MSEPIRIRVCLAVVEKNKILLVPHYNTDAGPVQWHIPGGKLEYLESLPEAAKREFYEETGYQAKILGLLDVSEVLIPERPYHSIAITYSGKITGGQICAEAKHVYGKKIPCWFTLAALEGLKTHSEPVVHKAFEMIPNYASDDNCGQ